MPTIAERLAALQSRRAALQGSHVPAGGTTGQVLTKTGGGFGWADAGAGAAAAESFMGAPVFLKPAAGVWMGNILSGTLNTQASAVNREDVHPFLSPFDFSIDQAGLSVSTAVAGSACAVIYASDANGRPTGLPTRSATMDSGTAGTKTAALTFSFEKGKLYWIGHRTTAACTLRCAQVYSAFTLSWTTAATPVRDGVLRRTVTFADTTTGWSYSAAAHASGAPSLVLMRIA